MSLKQRKHNHCFPWMRVCSSTKQKGSSSSSSSLQCWRKRANLTEGDRISLWPPPSTGQQQQRGHLSPNLLLCCHRRGGRREKYHKRHHKTNRAILVKSNEWKRCAATTQYCLLFRGLLPCGAQIRSYPSRPLSATWGFHYGPTQYAHRLHPAAHKSNAKEPISSYLHE